MWYMGVRVYLHLSAGISKKIHRRYVRKLKPLAIVVAVVWVGIGMRYFVNIVLSKIRFEHFTIILGWNCLPIFGIRNCTTFFFENEKSEEKKTAQKNDEHFKSIYPLHYI